MIIFLIDIITLSPEERCSILFKHLISPRRQKCVYPTKVKKDKLVFGDCVKLEQNKKSWILAVRWSNIIVDFDICGLIPPQQMIQSMYCRYNVQYLWPGSTAYVPEKQFRILALLSLYSTVSMISLYPHHFLTLSILWKKMGIAKKKTGLPVFDADILNAVFFFFFFFLSAAEIITWPPGKTGAHTPAVEGLRLD